MQMDEPILFRIEQTTIEQTIEQTTRSGIEQTNIDEQSASNRESFETNAIGQAKWIRKRYLAG